MTEQKGTSGNSKKDFSKDDDKQRDIAGKSNKATREDGSAHESDSGETTGTTREGDESQEEENNPGSMANDRNRSGAGKENGEKSGNDNR